MQDVQFPGRGSLAFIKFPKEPGAQLKVKNPSSTHRPISETGAMMAKGQSFEPRMTLGFGPGAWGAGGEEHRGGAC